MRDGKEEEMKEISKNHQHNYLIPSKILFDAELTINELRIYCIVSSYDLITRSFVKEIKGRLENYHYEFSIDSSIQMLLAKGYLFEDEGYLSISNENFIDKEIDPVLISI